MTGPIKSRTSLTLLAAAAAIGCASIPWEKRPVAAVMPFSYNANLPEHASSVSGLADALAGALLRTDKLRLVERQRMETVLSELRLGATGVVDSKTATEVGKQLGAKLVVLGSIVSISVREEGRSVKIAEKTDRWVEIEAEARLVDVETGELMATGRAFGKAHSAEKHAFGGKIGQLAAPEALVQKALQGMGEKLARDLSSGIRVSVK